MKILIVEDEVLLANSLKTLLEKKGFTVEVAYDGETGKDYAETGVYDLLILDVMMPKLNGYDLARQVRAERCATPILMLTAKGELEDRIEGLNAGADYYLTKPFGVMELVSCVKAVLRRVQPKAVEHLLKTGGLFVNLDEHTVSADGARVELTYKEFELLKLFLSHPGVAWTREKLMEQVWGTDYCGETRTVDMHIRTLRQKLGSYGDRIETVRGVGYRWEAQT